MCCIFMLYKCIYSPCFVEDTRSKFNNISNQLLLRYSSKSEQQEIDTLARIQIVMGYTMENALTSVKRSFVYKADEGQLKEEGRKE